MKKFTAVLLSFILCLSLFACAPKEKKTEEEGKEAFKVYVINDSENAIYALSYNFYLNASLIGSGAGCRADEKPTKSGDAFYLEFISSDFPRGASLSEFEIEFFVTDKDKGEDIPVERKIKIEAEYGKTYNFSIKGGYKKGFQINYIENP